MQRSAGFTLVEILLSLVLLSVLSVAIVQSVSILSNISRQTQVEVERETNRLLGGGLLQWSSEQAGAAYGQLPAPFTGTVGGQDYSFAITDPESIVGLPPTIRLSLNDSGASLDKFYDDGSPAQNVRVYQRLDDQVAVLPLSGFSGETANITYDIGVIYSTFCQREDAVCNTALPGDSPALTAANVSLWTSAGTDYGPSMINTLAMQKRALRKTMAKLDFIKERMRESFYAQTLAAPGGDTTNWYYAPTGAGAPDLSGATPATNLGCYDGWYDLTDGNTNVLERFELSQAKYSVTEWGGEIFYCRDFSPAANGEGVQPHAAALKIHRNVTSASTPTNVVADNIVVSF